MKNKIQQWFWDFVYNHPMSLLHTQRVTHEMLKKQEEMFFVRFSLEKVQEAIDEAKKNNHKYFTFANLLISKDK